LLLLARSLLARRGNSRRRSFPAPPVWFAITKKPVLFAAIVAVVSLVCSLPYAWLAHRNRGIVWHPEALMPFSASVFFEGFGRYGA
jgi:ABC-type spermidine/putrescine transport system permease subunit I